MKRTVHIFNCSTDNSLYGMTLDKTGANLPNEYCRGKWVYIDTISIATSDPRLISGVLPKDVLEAIDEVGYYLTQVQIKVSEQILPR